MTPLGFVVRYALAGYAVAAMLAIWAFFRWPDDAGRCPLGIGMIITVLLWPVVLPMLFLTELSEQARRLGLRP